MPPIRVGNKTVPDLSVVKWDSSFRVGISEMDQQHQIMMSMINELNDSIIQCKSREILEKALDGLVLYAKKHFAVEEKLFLQYAYPWTATHQAEHQAFLQKVTEILQEYQNGKSCLDALIPAFMSSWLKNHIIGKDKTYSYFFVMKGLK